MENSYHSIRVWRVLRGYGPYNNPETLSKQPVCAASTPVIEKIQTAGKETIDEGHLL